MLLPFLNVCSKLLISFLVCMVSLRTSYYGDSQSVGYNPKVASGYIFGG